MEGGVYISSNKKKEKLNFIGMMNVLLIIFFIFTLNLFFEAKAESGFGAVWHYLLVISVRDGYRGNYVDNTSVSTRDIKRGEYKKAGCAY